MRASAVADGSSSSARASKAVARARARASLTAYLTLVEELGKLGDGAFAAFDWGTCEPIHVPVADDSFPVDG